MFVWGCFCCLGSCYCFIQCKEGCNNCFLIFWTITFVYRPQHSWSFGFLCLGWAQIYCCTIFEPSSLENVVAKEDWETWPMKCKSATYWKSVLNYMRNFKVHSHCRWVLKRTWRIRQSWVQFWVWVVFYATTKFEKLDFLSKTRTSLHTHRAWQSSGSKRMHNVAFPWKNCRWIVEPYTFFHIDEVAWFTSVQTTSIVWGWCSCED